ncbi:hypothetical protein SAMN05880590_104113 [Rhizobium sp. RU35A]|uniref:hypothetical protein n=1 Tax=Rhizobium sp. RU35A TaxID=1907414 RepID=UPI0009552FB3|nr:hypothetical protein [Rhizobium sp. RU35A]SIQ43935.1 hypothetical protein SAMN05880590_104113 [Rhizobium sp. RU35A]
MSPWLQSLTIDLPMIAASASLSSIVVFLLTLAFTQKGERSNILVLIVGLAVLGAVSGVAGGSSRVGVVGDVIPAALGLVGGVSAYLFGVDRSKGLVASVCAAAFALSLGLGYAAGAGSRTETEDKQARLDFCEKLLADAKVWADDRAFCRVVTVFGEECSWLLADGFSRVPEVGVTKEEKFKHAFGAFHAGLTERARTLTGCTLPVPVAATAARGQTN